MNEINLSKNSLLNHDKVPRKGINSSVVSSCGRRRDRRQRNSPFSAATLWPRGPSGCVREGGGRRPSCHCVRQSPRLRVWRFYYSLPQPPHARVCQTIRLVPINYRNRFVFLIKGQFLMKSVYNKHFCFNKYIFLIPKGWSIAAAWQGRRLCSTERSWYWRRQTGTCLTCLSCGGAMESASYACRCGWRKSWRNSWGESGTLQTTSAVWSEGSC